MTTLLMQIGGVGLIMWGVIGSFCESSDGS